MLAILAVIWLRELWVTARDVEPVPYSQFLQLLEQNKITEIAIRYNVIQGSLKEALPDGEKKFITTRVDPDLAKQLAQHNVTFRGVIENTFFRDLLSWVLPALVFFGLWAFFIRKMAERQGLGGSFMSLGKSKAKVYVETDTKVTFGDVAGVDEAKT